MYVVKNTLIRNTEKELQRSFIEKNNYLASHTIEWHICHYLIVSGMAFNIYTLMFILNFFQITINL